MLLIKDESFDTCGLSCFSCVWLFVKLWTVACQASLSMGFSSKNTGAGCHPLVQGSNLNVLSLHWQMGSLPLAPPDTGWYQTFLPHHFVLFKCYVQFSSVTQSCQTLCDTMNCMPVLPVHYQLPESTQTHVHWASGTIQPSHPLLSPSPPALNLSQHQGLFKWVSSLHQVAKVLEFQLQHQSFQWTPRTDFL